MPPIRLASLTLGCALGVSALSAQTPRAVASVTHVEGGVFLDDQAVMSSATPATLGDSATIRTTTGRAVIAMNAGGVLAVDGQSTVRVMRPRDTDTFSRVEVLEGTAVLVSGTSAPNVDCRSQARLSAAGVFRFDVQREPGGSACLLRVYEGAAAVSLSTLTAAMRSGQAMLMDPHCGDMVPTKAFAADRLDDFDRWSREQARALTSN